MKPEQPDMDRDCWVNYGGGKAKYFPTVTLAMEFISGLGGLNFEPVRIFDNASMKDLTYLLNQKKPTYEKIPNIPAGPAQY